MADSWALAEVRLFLTVLITPSFPTVTSNGVESNSYPLGASISVTVKLPFFTSSSEYTEDCATPSAFVVTVSSVAVAPDGGVILNLAPTKRSRVFSSTL